MVCVGERRRKTILVGDVARKRTVTVVGHRDPSLGDSLGIGVALGSGLSFTDGIGVCFAHVSQTVLNGPEVHRAVGAVARVRHGVAGLVHHVKHELPGLEPASFEHFLGLEVRLAGGVIRIGEARGGGALLAGTDCARGTRRNGLLEARGLGLGHLVGGLGGNARDGRRLAAAQLNGVAVAHRTRGDLRACRVGHRVGERAALGLALGGGQRQLERELLLRAHVRGTLYGLADLERTVRVVRVGYIRAGYARHVALIVGVLTHLVCNLYAMVAVLEQATEAVAPIARVRSLDGLALDQLAIGVEVDLNLLGALARSVVGVVPNLAAGDLDRLDPMLVGNRKLITRVGRVHAHVGQIALGCLFLDAVGDGIALVIENAQSSIRPKACLPIVSIAQHGALARVLSIGVQMHRHALGALAVLVIAVGPCLLYRDAKRLETDLGVVLADHLVGRLHAHVTDCRAAQDSVVVGMGAAGETGLALFLCKVGIEPLAVRGGILLKVLDLGRTHANRKRRRIALVHHKVAAVGLFGGVHGNRGHVIETPLIRFRRRPDGAILEVGLSLLALGIECKLVCRHRRIVHMRIGARTLEGAHVHTQQAALPHDIARIGLVSLHGLARRVERIDCIEEADVLGTRVVGVVERDAVAVHAVLKDVASAVLVEARAPRALVVGIDLLVELRHRPRQVVELDRYAGIYERRVIALGIKVGHGILDALDRILGRLVVARKRVVGLALVASDGTPAGLRAFVGNVVDERGSIVALGVERVDGVERQRDYIAVAVVGLVTGAPPAAILRIGGNARFHRHERTPGALIVALEAHALHRVVAIELDGAQLGLNALGQQIVEGAGRIGRKDARRRGLVVVGKGREVGLLVHVGRVVERGCLPVLVGIVFHALVHADAGSRACQVIVSALGATFHDEVVVEVVVVRLGSVAQDRLGRIGVLKELVHARTDALRGLKAHVGVHGIGDARRLGAQAGLDIGHAGVLGEQQSRSVCTHTRTILRLRGNHTGTVADGAVAHPVVALLGTGFYRAPDLDIGLFGVIAVHHIAVVARPDAAIVNSTVGVLVIAITRLRVALVAVDRGLVDAHALKLKVVRREVVVGMVEAHRVIGGLHAHGLLAVVAREELVVVGLAALVRGPGSGKAHGLHIVAAHGIAPQAQAVERIGVVIVLATLVRVRTV